MKISELKKKIAAQGRELKFLRKIRRALRVVRERDDRENEGRGLLGAEREIENLKSS